MKAILTLVSATAILAICAAPSQAASVNDPLSPCWSGPPSTTRGFAEFSAKVWSRHLWRRGAPSGKAVAHAALREQCAPSPAARRAMRRRWSHDKGSYGRWRAYRLIAPYYFGEPTLPFVSIPPYVVRCETSGYYGAGRWGAVNPSSGARSVYQMLPSTYYGVCHSCDWSRLDQHRAARAVWARSGGSEWQCA